MMILISPVMGENNQSMNNTTYRVLVDQHHGFYRVYAVNNMTAVSYDKLTIRNCQESISHNREEIPICNLKNTILLRKPTETNYELDIKMLTIKKIS